VVPTAIDDLIKLAEPLKGVKKPKAKDWKRIEDEKELSFPNDYKEFVDVYGACVLLNCLGIHSPFTKPSLFDHHRQIRKLAGSVAQFFPDSPGLLECGSDEYSSLLMWKADASVPPDDWTMLYTQSNFIYSEDHECGLVEYLVKWLRGEIAPEWLPTLEELQARGPVVKALEFTK